MKNKFTYSLLVLSYGGKLPPEKKLEVCSLSLARKAKAELLKSVSKHFFVRIVKELSKPKKVFQQSTIYDFIGA